MFKDCEVHELIPIHPFNTTNPNSRKPPIQKYRAVISNSHLYFLSTSLSVLPMLF